MSRNKCLFYFLAGWDLQPVDERRDVLQRHTGITEYAASDWADIPYEIRERLLDACSKE